MMTECQGKHVAIEHLVFILNNTQGDSFSFGVVQTNVGQNVTLLTSPLRLFVTISFR
jgi:hypothetical protein